MAFAAGQAAQHAPQKTTGLPLAGPDQARSLRLCPSVPAEVVFLFLVFGFGLLFGAPPVTGAAGGSGCGMGMGSMGWAQVHLRQPPAPCFFGLHWTPSSMGRQIKPEAGHGHGHRAGANSAPHVGGRVSPAAAAICGPHTQNILGGGL
jgi:hypothetical protein